MDFGNKNSDLSLLHKINSFDLKNIKNFFLELKNVFLVCKRSDLFYDNEKKCFLITENHINFYVF